MRTRVSMVDLLRFNRCCETFHVFCGRRARVFLSGGKGMGKPTLVARFGNALVRRARDTRHGGLASAAPFEKDSVASAKHRSLLLAGALDPGNHHVCFGWDPFRWRERRGRRMLCQHGTRRATRYVAFVDFAPTAESRASPAGGTAPGMLWTHPALLVLAARLDDRRLIPLHCMAVVSCR
jgi:hypothetical protein